MVQVWEAVDKLTGSVAKVFKTLEAAQSWMFRQPHQKYFLRRSEYYGGRR